MKLKLRRSLASTLAFSRMNRLSFFVRVASVGLGFYSGGILAQGGISMPGQQRAETALQCKDDIFAIVQSQLAEPFISDAERLRFLEILEELNTGNESSAE